MSFRLPGGCGLALAVAGVAGLCVCSGWAQGKPTGREPEFSEHSSAEVTTNLLQLGTRTENLRQLEDELNRSFQTYSPKNSLEGALAPPMPPSPLPQSPAQARMMRELLQRQKEWIFMTPEELATPPSAEDLLSPPEYGPDGKQRSKLSPMERFYQNLVYPEENARKPGLEKDPLRDSLRPDKALGKDEQAGLDNALPRSVRDSEKALKKLLGTDSTASASPAVPTRSLLSDVFHLDKPMFSAEELKQRHDDYMRQFETLLDNPPPASSLQPLNPLADANDPLRAAIPSAGLPGSSSRPDGYDPTLGAVNPTYVPAAPGDFNAKLLNQWNPDYVPPKSEPPPLPTPTPNFTAPRRAF